MASRMQTKAGLSRRRTLALAGGLALAAGGARGVLARSRQHHGEAEHEGAEHRRGSLPVKQIEDILQIKGKTEKGVFSAEIGRKDLKVMGPHDIHFTSAWQIHHEFEMQPLGHGRAIFNAELALQPHEVDPVVDQILKQKLVFQAMHEHFMGLSPMIFHVHLRGSGDPIELAKAYISVIKTTPTPLPQQEADNPKTPLDHKRLAHILGGDAEVAEDGVVSVKIPRKNKMRLGGRRISPILGVNSHVDFQPLGPSAKTASNGNQATTGQGSRNGGALRTAVAPDLALTAPEVDKVMKITRAAGFEVHCLYNQETAEHPQLYFSHQLAVGDAEHYARVLRHALEQTDSEFKSG